MNANSLILIVAAGCGLLAAVLGFLFLSQARTSQAPPQTYVDTVQVMVAKADLPAGLRIETDRDLEPMEIPATSGMYARAFKPDEAGELQGVELEMPLRVGDPLLYTHLRGFTQLDFPEQLRAMTIPADELRAIGGLLVPGDRIDILLTQEEVAEAPSIPTASTPQPVASSDPTSPDEILSQLFSASLGQSMPGGGGGTGVFNTTLVLENVRVIAIDDRLTGTRLEFAALTLDPERSGSLNVPGTITLEVTREQAVQYLNATGGGQRSVTLLLRSPRENRPIADVEPLG
ncbi:MAG: Flp pilus assembly protein CpaB [Planctomycetota bacterium]